MKTIISASLKVKKISTNKRQTYSTINKIIEVLLRAFAT
jgi:hypothetical protein